MINERTSEVGKLVLVVRMQSSMIERTYPLDDGGGIVGGNILEDTQ